MTQWNSALEGLHAGGAEGFEKFLTLVQGTVYSFGRKLCGHVEDAEDIMQQTLLKAFEQLPELEFNDERALKVWLYRVAKTSCLMMRRKSKFEPARLLSLEDYMPKRPSDGPFNVPDWSHLPDEEMFRKEIRGFIDDALQKLDSDHKVVLVLRDMEQLSTEETAEVLNITPANVKMRLHRARLFLRQELEKHFAASHVKN